MKTLKFSIALLGCIVMVPFIATCFLIFFMASGLDWCCDMFLGHSEWVRAWFNWLTLGRCNKDLNDEGEEE